MGSKEQRSFRDSQPWDVSDRVLRPQLAVHPHLRIRVRLRPRRGHAFDQGWIRGHQLHEPSIDMKELTYGGLLQRGRGVLGRQLHELERFLSFCLLPSRRP